MAKNTAELREEIKEIRKEMNKKEQKWEEEKKELVSRIEKLEERAQKEERCKRRNNIVITGLTTTRGKEKEAIEDLITAKLKVQAKITNAYQIGKEQQSHVIIAEVESWERKQEIMANKMKLRNTRIYINNDLTTEERRIQKEIRSIAREEKAKGNKVKTGYQKIILNDKEYRWNEVVQGVTIYENPKNSL